MITNEAETRVALQAVLVSVLALNGYWGLALVVMVIMLPWKPIFVVGGYLAQPLVDWRVKKARARQEKGIGQVEQELDTMLPVPRRDSGPAVTGAAKGTAPANPQPSPLNVPPEPFEPNLPGKPAFHDIPNGSAQDLAATLAIPPAIKDHVRNLPQGVFRNMDLEVEEVKFHGDTAEAQVRFRSPNVTELSIRQNYVLRKSGQQWQVESRQPVNGGSGGNRYAFSL